MEDILKDAQDFFGLDGKSSKAHHRQGLILHRRNPLHENRVSKSQWRSLGTLLNKATYVSPKQREENIYERYTFLKTTQKEILNQMEGQNILKKPNPMKSNPQKQDCAKYC